MHSSIGKCAVAYRKQRFRQFQTYAAITVRKRTSSNHLDCVRDSYIIQIGKITENIASDSFYRSPFILFRYSKKSASFKRIFQPDNGKIRLTCLFIIIFVENKFVFHAASCANIVFVIFTTKSRFSVGRFPVCATNRAIPIRRTFIPAIVVSDNFFGKIMFDRSRKFFRRYKGKIQLSASAVIYS